MAVRIANADIAAVIVPGNGARITSLVDLATGREWMAQGDGTAPRAPDQGDGAIYGADDAVGWDECFPTVSPWDASGTVWGRTLRDHGMLWGRPAELVEATATRAVTRFAGPLCTFTRTTEVQGRVLAARYRLDNHARADLPWLWAAHGMLAVTPADRIILPDVDRVEARHLIRDGHLFVPQPLDWPGPNPAWPVPLDRVEPADARAAAKLYVDGLPGADTFVGNDADGWLRIGWSDGIAALGIWLNYGGWPGPGTVHHIGIETTNAPVDHLGQAIARSTPALPAGASLTWEVQYEVRPARP